MEHEMDGACRLPRTGERENMNITFNLKTWRQTSLDNPDVWQATRLIEGPIAGSRGDSNETWGSIKGRFIDYVSDYQLLMNDYALDN
jgi:hypothetical protein